MIRPMKIKVALTALLLALPLLAFSSAKADPCPFCATAHTTTTTSATTVPGN